MKKTLVLTTLLGALFTQSAFAAIVHFAQTNPNNNNLNANVLGQQLTMEITSAGVGLVDFKFTNPVGLSSSIQNIYFGVFDGAAPVLTGVSVFSQTAGVDFPDNGVTPTGFPQGVAHNFTTLWGVDTEGNAKARVVNGINAAGENLVIRGTYNTGTYSSYNLVLDALLNTSGVGLIVRDTSIDGKPSTDNYLSIRPEKPSQVPVPAAAWLFATGLGVFGFGRRVKSKA